MTVTGVQDPVDDGTAAWNVRLDPASGDADYDTLDSEDVSVSTTDDDGPPTVTLALNPASIAESGAGNVATVTVRLSHASGAATTVTGAAGTDATIVIAAGATQAASDTATVVAANNTRDEPDRTGTVTATVANARATADSTTMTVTGAALTVRDDDPAPTAALSLSPASVSENGGLSTVTATLSHPSSESSTVTVTAGSGASGLYTVGLDATIVIAAGAPTAASDTATATGGRGVAAPSPATLVIRDDEYGLDVSVAAGLTTTEGGGTAPFTVALRTQPSAAVTVSVTRWDADGLLEDASEGRVEPSSLVFTTGNWETAQTVTAATLTIADDDEKGLAFADGTGRAFAPPSPLAVAEGDPAGAPYTVTLTSRPAGTVTVAVASDNAEVEVSPAHLTFAPSDWNEAQTVTVTAHDDGDDYADAAVLTHTASGGGYDDGDAVVGTLAVAVDSERGTKLVVGGAGETTYRIGGRTVTVVVRSGVPEGIELDLTDLPDASSHERLTLAFAPVEAPAASDAFTYESAGRARWWTWR